MKAELKYFVWAVGLGAGVLIYAQSSFTTKTEGKMIYRMIEKLDKKMDRVVDFLLKEKK